MPSLPKPSDPRFGSGPTRKYPTWSATALAHPALGTSHRGPLGLGLLAEVEKALRDVLELPPTHKIAFVAGGCTGAMEILLWNLCGPRPLTAFASGVFGNHWAHDVSKELPLLSTSIESAPFSALPPLERYTPNTDAIFVWNETTTGACIPNANWIPEKNEGLTICDAASAVFCCRLPWEKLDAVAFSWQKGLGAEGGLSSIVLSPRAIERLRSYRPTWPLPRLLRIPHWQTTPEAFAGFFAHETINTVSLLSAHDMLRALQWAQTLGGLSGLLRRQAANFHALESYVNACETLQFVVAPAARSHTSICLTSSLFPEQTSEKWRFLHKTAAFLRDHNVAYDIVNHAASIPCLRIWCGPTVEASDVALLMPWLEEALRHAAQP